MAVSKDTRHNNKETDLKLNIQNLECGGPKTSIWTNWGVLT